MAEWKKVIVSGSNISQLNNDAGFITSGDLAGLPSGTVSGSVQVDHDATTNFVANEHIDHSSVTLTAGNGLTGGGNITTSRSFAVGQGSGISVTADAVAVDATVLRTTGGSIVSASAQVDHDQTTNFVANEHVDHSSVSITAGSGLTGGGTIAATRTINVGAGDGISVSADAVAVDATVLRTTGDNIVSSSAQINLGSATGNIALGTQTTGNYVATLGTGTGVTIGSNTGEGSTPTIAVNYGSTANTAVQGNTSITFAGTANEITVDGGSSITLGSGGTVTYGLADTITGNRTFSGTTITVSNNLTVGGNLVVTGTVTNVNATDLNIEDKFILLNSGSSSGNSGIIVQNSATTGQGTALFYDDTADRWGMDAAGADAIADTATADAYVAGVVTSDDAAYRKNGNIRVQGGDIYIYVE